MDEMRATDAAATGDQADDEAAKTIALAEGMAERACRTYRAARERAALRCALGDAAHLCDALGRAAAELNPGRGRKGSVSKTGQALQRTAALCGNIIFGMRDLIDVPDDDCRDMERGDIYPAGA